MPIKRHNPGLSVESGIWASATGQVGIMSFDRGFAQLSTHHARVSLFKDSRALTGSHREAIEHRR